MDIAGLIRTYGIENTSNAVVLGVNGDIHTGRRSYWVPASSLDLSNPQDTSAEIIRELPDMVFEAADGSVWKVST